MPDTNIESKTVPAAGNQHASFFKQSGWLMIANVGGGVLMWAVHFLSKKIPKAEYGTFVALLGFVMCIPTLPLQMVIVHQTAQRLARGRLAQLSSMIRSVTLATFLIWVVGVICAAIFQSKIVEHWHLSNPACIYVTLGVALMAVWQPIFWGAMQGQQNFLWLGWSMISNAVGRLTIATLAVVVLGAYVTGMMVGVVSGMIISTLFAIWMTRSLWLPRPQTFNWRELLREVLPPMFGFAAFSFLFTGDTMFVKAYFSDDDAAFYGSAGTLSRALMWLVGPLATVMFPRIVHSVAKAEKSNLMTLVLVGTGVLSALGALSLTILGPYIVPIVYPKDYVQAAMRVLPWYAAAMVPLSIGNVLLNNLLARSSFKVVAPVCVLAITYGWALTKYNKSLIMVLQTMGIFNLGLLAICGLFTCIDARRRPS
jgi:O-antigen/teichoic acid export membrane protein